jgi:hypothetical protein
MKKIRNTVLSAVLLMLAGGFFSCNKNGLLNELMEGSKSNTNENEISLKGTTWKLVGIVNAETGELRELEPKHCEECYTLTFDTDITAIAQSINIKLRLDLLNFSHIGTYLHEIYNRQLFCETYDKDVVEGERYSGMYCDSDRFRRGIMATSNFSKTGDELKLYTAHIAPTDIHPEHISTCGKYSIGPTLSYLLFKPFKNTSQ